MLLEIFALGTLIVVIGIAAELLRGMHSIRWLSDQLVEDSYPPSRVSIIVAARNEEKHIRKGISSLLKLDYPNKEVIVVNDRSTDGTAAILKDLNSVHPQLRIVTVKDLPPGWLGKNHALWAGAAVADGDLFLFTDADVVMDETVLKRSVPLFENEGLDHLAIGPRAVMPGVWLNIFMAGFGLFFNMFARPWRVRNPKSSAHIGIGAFNMIRKEAYQKIGTHQALAMRPDDDMKLGKLIKLKGLKQDFLLGTDLIFVEWYDSVKALVNGLMKNAFSGVDYRISVVIGSSIVQLALGIWPFVALAVTDGWTRLAYLGVVLIIVSLCALSAHVQGLNLLYGLGFPLAALAFMYILWKATIRTLIRGGIEWRGTFYPLDQLRKNVL